MADHHSSPRFHMLQNALLILLSIILLPFSTALLWLAYTLHPFMADKVTQKRLRKSTSFHPKTVLVTGVGMTKGLALARLFYEAGHDVIGADFEPDGIPVNGRFSRSLKKFYTLPKPNDHDGSTFYVSSLINIVRKNNVVLWVSCSGVASAVEDGQAAEILSGTSDCNSIQFDAHTTSTLHEKHSFIQYTSSLGLPTPETHNVTSRAAVHNVLNRAEKKRYIMKSAGVDDAMRGDMTILPRRSLSQTYQHVSAIPISKSKPWVLQQYVRGKEYCTHALVINGQVQAFVACPSLELLMHYEALPAESPLSEAMLRFTQEFAWRSGHQMTGHLSFDFLVDEKATEKGAELVLQPIECNPRAHTAVLLFNGLGTEMATAYLSGLETTMNGVVEAQHLHIVTPSSPAKYYWIGHDLVTLLVFPILGVVTGKQTTSTCFRSFKTFIEHLIFWKEATFEVWDPMPWFWLYHVYWPGQFAASIIHGRHWSRINVSTTKMFEC